MKFKVLKKVSNYCCNPWYYWFFKLFSLKKHLKTLQGIVPTPFHVIRLTIREYTITL